MDFKDRIKSLVPLKSFILFESYPDFTDNTRAVFDEMVRREINKKYKLIWMCNSKHESGEFPSFRNVEYVYRHDTIGRYYRQTAKYLVSCNDFLANVRDGQFSLFLTHGSSLKNTTHYFCPENIDKVLAASEGANELTSKYFRYDKSRGIALGFPRNDVFACPPKDIREIFGNYKKIIVWYPTFRQLGNNSLTLAKGNPVPVIHDYDDAEIINRYAVEKGILIVMKPHPHQNVDYIKNHNFSNIKFIDNEFLAAHNLENYELLNACDALITDYSSVYYDFLLADKPVAAVWEDLQEYLELPGLIDNYEYYMSGAEKVYNRDDFIVFLDNVACGRDPLREQRREIRDLMNYSTDGKNSERVVDYIMSVIEGKK